MYRLQKEIEKYFSRTNSNLKKKFMPQKILYDMFSLE